MNVRPKTRRRLLILVAGVVIVCGSLAVLYAVRMGRLRKYYANLRTQGISQFNGGDYAAAQISLSRYVRRDEYSRDAEALYYVAAASRRIDATDGGQRVLAASQLKRALELNPGRDDWRRELLRDYAALGYSSETVTTADVILKKYPDDKDALHAKAFALAARGDETEAIGVALRCLSPDVNPHDLGMHLLVLRLYRDPKNLADAPTNSANADAPDREAANGRDVILRRARKLLLENPQDGRFELLMSCAFSLVGELTPNQRGEFAALVKDLPDGPAEAAYAGAVHFARQAAKRELADAEHLGLLLEQLEMLGLAPESIQVAQKVTSFDDPRVRLPLLRCLFEAERYAEIEQRVAGKTLNPRATSDVEVLGMRAISLVRLGRKDEAASIAEQLTAQNENRAAQAWAAVVKHAFLGERGADGKDAQLRVIEATLSGLQQRNNPYLRFYLAEAYAAMGERELAIDSYAQATALSPLWTLPLMRLSKLQLEGGESEKAIGAAHAARRILPTWASAVNLAMTWAAAGEGGSWSNPGELLKLVAEIQRIAPGEEQTLPVYVALLAKMGQRTEAERVARQALDQEKVPAESTLLRVAAASRTAGLGLEEACFARAEKVYGLTTNVAFARASDMVARGAADEATRYLDAARSDKPKDQELPWRLAWVRHLEQIDDPRAAGEWAALGNDPVYETNLFVQRAVLESRSVQGDKQFLSRTIDRVRALTGEHGGAWRMARARLLLQDRKLDPDYAQTLALLNDIVRASPTDVEAHTLLAATLERTGDVHGAIQRLNGALTLRPTSALRLALAALHQSRSDFEQSRVYLNAINPAELNGQQRQRFASLHATSGNPRRAIAIMEEAPADRLDVAGVLLLADLHRSVGAPGNAEALFEHLRQRTGVTPADQLRIAIARADLLASTGRDREADAEIATAESLQVAPGTRGLAFGDHFARRQRHDAAIAQYRAATSADPSNATVWTALILQHLRAGTVPQAVAAGQEAAKLVAGSKTISRFAGNADLIRTVGAQPRFVPLIRATIEQPTAADVVVDAMRIVAGAPRDGGMSTDKLDRLRGLSDSSPYVVPLAVVLVQEYEAAGRRREACDMARRAMASSPASPELARLAAQMLAASGDAGQALTAARRWRELGAAQPLHPDLFIAQLHLQAQDPAAALRQLESYVGPAAADPDRYRDVIQTRAVALIKSGQHGAATELLLPLATASPQWREFWLQAALSIQGQGQVTTVASILERVTPLIPPAAVEEQTALAAAWCQLGIRAKDAASLQRGRQLLQQVIDANPNSATPLYTRGSIYEQQGDEVAAERDYRAAIAIDPKHGIALNNLAMIVTRGSGDAAQALGFATRAAEVFPRAATVQDTLAFVKAKARDYDGAVSHILMAVALEPNNPEWRVRLADIYQTRGDNEKALQCIRHIDLEYPDARKLGEPLRAKLDSIRGALQGNTANVQ